MAWCFSHFLSLSLTDTHFLREIPKLLAGKLPASRHDVSSSPHSAPNGIPGKSSSFYSGSNRMINFSDFHHIFQAAQVFPVLSGKFLRLEIRAAYRSREQGEWSVINRAFSLLSMKYNTNWGKRERENKKTIQDRQIKWEKTSETGEDIARVNCNGYIYSSSVHGVRNYSEVSFCVSSLRVSVWIKSH